MGTRSLSNGKLTINLSGLLKNLLTDGSEASISHPSASYSSTIQNGVEVNQANRAWQSKNRVLNGGVSEVFDLFNFTGVDLGAGAGDDGLGQDTDPFDEIVTIMIVNENAATAAGTLEIEPDAANGWTPIGTHTAANGGGLLGQGVLVKSQPATTGFPITDGSNFRLKITANGAVCTYSIYLLARNDAEASSSSSSSQSISSESSASSSSSTSTSISSVSSTSESSTSSTSSSTSSVSSISTSSTSSVSGISSTSSASSISTSSSSQSA